MTFLSGKLGSSSFDEEIFVQSIKPKKRISKSIQFANCWWNCRRGKQGHLNERNNVLDTTVMGFIIDKCHKDILISKYIVMIIFC